MKISLTKPLVNFKGETINFDDGKPLTVRHVIERVLFLEDQEHLLTPERKNQAYQIAIKLCPKDEIDLTAEQIAFLKERIGIFENGLIMGQMFEILEGKKVSLEKETDKS